MGESSANHLVRIHLPRFHCAPRGDSCDECPLEWPPHLAADAADVAAAARFHQRDSRGGKRGHWRSDSDQQKRMKRRRRNW